MFDSDITQKLTNRAKKTLKESQDIAVYCKAKNIEPIHLLFAIYLEKGCVGNTILKNIGIKKSNFSKVTSKVKTATKNNPIKNLKFSNKFKEIITKAYSLANSLNYPYVGTEHLTYALLETNDSKIKNILKNAKITKNEAQNQLRANLKNDSFPNLSRMFDLPEITLTKKQDTNETSFLQQFCVNLNEDSTAQKEIIIGREAEIERLCSILGRKTKNNPILIGEPGVGKSAIVNGLAQKINNGSAPFHLLDKTILMLDITLIVAGTSFRGEFEARIKEIIKEVNQQKNIILFIDEIHTIIGAGNANGGLDVANILKPALSRGEIQCIGATTLDEYTKHFEKDPALERRFQPIQINEPTVIEANKIISGLKRSFENYHNTKITPCAIKEAVELSVRYMPDRFLPDKAIDLIDEASSLARSKSQVADTLKQIKNIEMELKTINEIKDRLIQEERYEEAVQYREEALDIKKELTELKNQHKKVTRKSRIQIDKDDIARTVSQITKIPYEKISSSISQPKNIANINRKIKQHISGQDEIINTIAKTLVKSQTGLSNPDRPLASFLFLGPTGVGKTYTAKILSELLFDSDRNLIRIDMSEFMERHNVSKIIGAPAGYVGFGEGGNITDRIRKNPYSVVLFDEIEKAHPEVWNILLQVMEDGMLTDGQGRKIDFKNTIIILTSNLGTSEFTNTVKLGFNSNEASNSKFNEIKENVLKNLKQNMSPEFLNRLDNILIFNSLCNKSIYKISKKELTKLKQRLKKQNISLTFSERTLRFISQKSVSAEQGARLIRKNIQTFIEDEIADFILAGKMSDKKLCIDADENGIILK